MSRKRGQNEGSIFKRKDGLWVAQATVEGKHVSKYFHSQSECREWLRATQEQIRNGLTLAGAQNSLADFLREWLVAKSSAVHHNTAKQYKQIIEQHIVPALGDIKLKDLRPDAIQALYNTKLKAGKSARTVILIHAVLHMSLKQAMKWGKIGRNPVEAVTRPRFKRKEMRVLDDKQVRTLLMAAKGSRYEALLRMAVSTGMRESELLGLRWSDIEWKAKRVSVQRQLQLIDGEYVFTNPKTAAGRRVIALGAGMLAVLRGHQDVLAQERRTAGERWVANDLVFPSTRGTPGDKHNLLKAFKGLLEAAGLPAIRFHDLRHTAATLLLQQGVNPKVVQERLGHADISLTLNTYSHVLPSMQEDAAEKVDELLTPIDVSDELNGLKERRSYYQTDAPVLSSEVATGPGRSSARRRMSEQRAGA